MSEVQTIKPIDAFRNTMSKMEKQLAATLPPEIPAQRFIRTVITTVQMNPALLDADRESLLATCMFAAQDGLLLDGREAAAVTYYDSQKGKKTVSYIPMVNGIIKKMHQSRKILSITACAAYESDHFKYIIGDNERIEHERFFGNEDSDRGRVIAYYAIVKTKDGGIYRLVMSPYEVKKRRDVSAAKDSKKSPWNNWEEEMGIKTVLKRLAKMLPLSPDDLGIELNEEESYQDVTETSFSEPEKPSERAEKEPHSSLRLALGINAKQTIEEPITSKHDEEQ
jgi:recombination protein RecT